MIVLYKHEDYLNMQQKSKLGFGAMRLPNDEITNKMVDAFLDAGYNYFDTAYIYDGSEERLNRTLVKRHPRESYFVANKLPPWHVHVSADRDKLFKESLKRTGLEYFDYYLVHSLDESREESVDKAELFQWAFEQKKKGLVKHVGFSYHGGTEYLKRLFKRYPESEFVQLQLNYIDIMRGPAGEWQKAALEAKVPIIVMEPVKGGSLATLPAPAEKLLKDYDPSCSVASWAIRYAANLEGATCVLSGMSNLEQVEDNLKTYENFKPLSKEEMELLDKVLTETAKVASIPCTGCKYCHNECPLGIEIATCISLYNELKRGSEKWNRQSLYRTIPAGKRASDCTSCGACMSHCPQRIDIPKELGVVAAELAQ